MRRNHNRSMALLALIVAAYRPGCRPPADNLELSRAGQNFISLVKWGLVKVARLEIGRPNMRRFHHDSHEVCTGRSHAVGKSRLSLLLEYDSLQPEGSLAFMYMSHITDLVSFL